jgi:hypothetical protein
VSDRDCHIAFCGEGNLFTLIPRFRGLEQTGNSTPQQHPVELSGKVGEIRGAPRISPEGFPQDPSGRYFRTALKYLSAPSYLRAGKFVACGHLRLTRLKAHPILFPV